jgi:hypothetical protein
MAVRVKAVPRMVASSFLACATSGSCLRCALGTRTLLHLLVLEFKLLGAVSGERGTASLSRGR